MSQVGTKWGRHNSSHRRAADSPARPLLNMLGKGEGMQIGSLKAVPGFTGRMAHKENVRLVLVSLEVGTIDRAVAGRLISALGWTLL